MPRSALGRRALAVPALLILLAVCSAPAHAAPAWSAEPADTTLVSAAPGPKGATLLFGWPQSNRLRIATRPAGGPAGAPEPLPVYASFYGPAVAFDRDGNALIGSRETTQLVHRSAAGAFSAVQSLAGFGGASHISMAPTGEALLGTDEGAASNGRVKVAFRPAGAGMQADIAGAQIFSPPPGASMQLIGLQLDPDGAAVVLMKEGSAIYQSTRAAGQASFSNPVPLTDVSGLRSEKYQLVFDSDPAGHSVLAFSTGRPADNGAYTRAVAAYRPPGGAFGAPQIVGAAADGESLSTVRAAINAGGDGLVAWTQTVATYSCSRGTSADFGVWVAHISGGAIGSGNAIGPAGFPDASSFRAVAAGGTTVGIAYDLRHRGADGDKCDVKDDKSEIVVRVYRSRATGPGLEAPADRLLEESTPSGLPAGQSQWRQPALAAPELVAGASGTLLVGTQAFSGGVLTRRVHIYEDAAAPPTDPAQPVNPGGGSGNGPGTTGTTPTPPVRKILPLVPKDLVVPAPITSRKRTVRVLCPPEVGDECLVHLNVYAAFGAMPKASAAAGKKKAALLASVRTRVRPGTSRTVRLKLTKAGRRAARVRRRKAARMVVTVTADGVRRSSTVKVRIGGR